jgi:hypothetical protein
MDEVRGDGDDDDEGGNSEDDHGEYEDGSGSVGDGTASDCNVSSRRTCSMQQHHSDAQRRHSGCCTALRQVSHRPQRQDQDSKGPSWCQQEPPGLYDIAEPGCNSHSGAVTNHSGHTEPHCDEGGQAVDRCSINIDMMFKCGARKE